MTWPREDVSASRSGVDSLTWTVSTTSPGVRVRRTVAFWSTWRVKAAMLERLKPGDWAEMVYSPAGRKVAWNSPRSPAAPVRVRPVALLVTVMVAAWMTAWVESSATTLMVPVAVWARTESGANRSKNAATWGRMIVRRSISHAPPGLGGGFTAGAGQWTRGRVYRRRFWAP